MTVSSDSLHCLAPLGQCSAARVPRVVCNNNYLMKKIKVTALNAHKTDIQPLMLIDWASVWGNSDGNVHSTVTNEHKSMSDWQLTIVEMEIIWKFQFKFLII